MLRRPYGSCGVAHTSWGGQLQSLQSCFSMLYPMTYFSSGLAISLATIQPEANRGIT